MFLKKLLIITCTVCIAFFQQVSAGEITKIKIATEGLYPPFNYYKPDGTLTGFEVDLAKELCKRMQVECEIVAQDWDGIIPALLAGKYDAIMAGMSATDDRKKVIDFSDIYENTPSSVIMKKGLSGDFSSKVLASKVIGAQSSSIQASYISKNFNNSVIKLYSTQDEVFMELVSGRIDALLVDKIVGYNWIKSKDSNGCCAFYGDDIHIGDGIAVGLRKSDAAIKKLFNKAIKEVKKDGTLDVLKKKYFDYTKVSQKKDK